MLLIAAPRLPFEPKQTECSLFSRSGRGERGRTEETDYVLDSNWKTEVQGVRENAVAQQGGGRGGRTKQAKRKRANEEKKGRKEKEESRKRERERDGSRDHARHSE